ncbi:MAG: helix-turn-helix transcriptional regulator [Deltaproteobacteria bacterium]|nr:helix-turn-helix transcriptional regulator [Deltaproteobacteria bacterium]
MADGCKVGERVRTYRERLQMTVEVLAEKSGVSAGVITAVEAGEVYPALGVLVKLSRALGQRLGTFMDDQYQPDPVIVRADARADEQTSHKVCESGGFRYFPLGRGKTDRHMDPFYIEIAADAQALTSSHEGEEFIVAISGEVELVYGGVTQILQPGDSAYYNSVVQHLVRAANGRPATIYAVVFMPF